MGSEYTPTDAIGFIKLFGLPMKVNALRQNPIASRGIGRRIGRLDGSPRMACAANIFFPYRGGSRSHTARPSRQQPRILAAPKTMRPFWQAISS